MALETRSYGQVGDNVSVIGLGGTSLSKHSFNDGVATVHRALELGVTYFDTSPAYGKAERHLGLGLRELSTGERAELTVSTKVGTHPERPQQYEDSLRTAAESMRYGVVEATQLFEAVHAHLAGDKERANAFCRRLIEVEGALSERVNEGA